MKETSHNIGYHNLRRSVAIAFLSINLALSGCVTTALWNAAEGQPSSQHGIKIRSITIGFKSSDGNQVNVCMTVYDFALRSEREMTLSIPVTDRRKWKIQRNLNSKPNDTSNAQTPATSTVITPVYIEYSPSMSSLVPGCITDGTRLPVLNSVVGDPQKNVPTNQNSAPANPDQKMADAIYVVNRDGLPVNIGYISDKPLLENSYSIDVPLHYISDQAGLGGKPYLYLLTPVTVAMDAAIVVLYVAALAYGSPNYQNQQPPLMIRSNSINGISK
jgi:hypothetical protein